MVSWGARRLVINRIATETLNLDSMILRLWGRKVSDLAFYQFVEILKFKCLKHNRTTQAVSDFITCNAEIMSGTPVFKNTRVPIKNLIALTDYLEAGDSLGRIFGRFPVCQPYPSCSGIRTREGDATHTSLQCYFKMFGELYA